MIPELEERLKDKSEEETRMIADLVGIMHRLFLLRRPTPYLDTERYIQCQIG
jgi:hypothetical protein